MRGSGEDAVVLWAITEAVAADTLALFRSWLPLENRPERSVLSSPGAPRDRVLAGGLLRLALSRELAMAPPGIELARDRLGKPHLAGEARSRAGPLAFSVSYSGGAAACVVHRGLQAGIDLESTARALPPPEIRETFLTPRERAYLEALRPERRDEGFLRLWTLKEAYLKARGVGLAVRPGSVGFRLPSSPREIPTLEEAAPEGRAPDPGASKGETGAPDLVFFQDRLPPRWIVAVAAPRALARLSFENLLGHQDGSPVTRVISSVPSCASGPPGTPV